MTAPLDLEPAARQMAALLDGITDDQLTAPTPCPEATLGDLVEHVSGLSLAFTAAAGKRLGAMTNQAPAPDAARLGVDWRTRIPAELAALVAAWRDPAAWEGMTQAGGVDLPAAVAGTVALDELVIHGWDIARASGQPFDADPASLEACTGFVAASAGPEHAAERQGLFGPPVEVPADASPLDRLIGLAGRDPMWGRG